jgi:glycosyltransferase involved in cell wall biosynthesis
MPEVKVIHSDPRHTPGDILDLTIVVPCLNEENNIAQTLDTIASAMSELAYSYEIIVVDDGSTDRTAAVVKEYAQAHLQLPIHLHQNPRNRGLTRSYVDASFLGRGRYYRLICGDASEPKESLLTIFSELGKADMIIPYQEITGKSAFRRGLSRVYTVLVNRLSGNNIKYYNGCALHLRYNVMRWGPYSFGFGFQAELITRLLDEGATYVEVLAKSNHRNKSGGNSALNLRNFLSVTHTLIEILIRRVRKRAFDK